jgi:hypothetical protein
MMHSATQLADTVISRSVYNRETTVKHVGQYGPIVGAGLKASLGVGVLEFERPHGRPLYRVLSPKSHISAHTYMEKFKPIICHISQFQSYLCATMSLVNFYTMEGHTV